MLNAKNLSENNLKKLNLYLKIKKQNNLYDLILGGSLSLILQEVIPQREVNDIDLCYFRFFCIPYTMTKKFDSIIQYEILGNNDHYKEYVGDKIDLFIDAKARYLKYRIKINDKIEYLNLQVASEIVEAKMIYLNRGVYKHLPDIQHYLNKMEEKNNKYKNKSSVNKIKTKLEINNDSFIPDDENIFEDIKENDNKFNLNNIFSDIKEWESGGKK